MIRGGMTAAPPALGGAAGRAMASTGKLPGLPGHPPAFSGDPPGQAAGLGVASGPGGAGSGIRG